MFSYMENALISFINNVLWVMCKNCKNVPFVEVFFHHSRNENVRSNDLKKLGKIIYAKLITTIAR